jgi:hypothetical protein
MWEQAVKALQRTVSNCHVVSARDINLALKETVARHKN